MRSIEKASEAFYIRVKAYPDQETQMLEALMEMDILVNSARDFIIEETSNGNGHVIEAICTSKDQVRAANRAWATLIPYNDYVRVTYEDRYKINDYPELGFFSKCSIDTLPKHQVQQKTIFPN